MNAGRLQRRYNAVYASCGSINASILLLIARLRVPAVSDDYRELSKTPYGILGK